MHRPSVIGSAVQAVADHPTVACRIDTLEGDVVTVAARSDEYAAERGLVPLDAAVVAFVKSCKGDGQSRRNLVAAAL